MTMTPRFPRAFALSWLIAALPCAALTAENWAQWRGPSLNGLSGERNLPTRWSTTENVAWKLALPAFSASTPIVWNDRIFLNVAEGNDLFLWAVDRTRGVPLWKRPLGAGNRLMRKHNMSSPSPVTDGVNVWAMTGTGILKAFDFGGNEIWTRDLPKDYGRFGMQYGYGASPLLFDDSLYVPVLHGLLTDDPSYVLRIRKSDGRTIWRVERPTNARFESPDAYTTPALLRYGTTVEIVVTGADAVTGHDPSTGKELWRADVLNPNNDGAYRIVASPFVYGETIFAPSRERPLLALKAGGRGDVSRSHVLWSFANGPDVPTPVTDGTYVYVINDRGIMYCLDAKTGKALWRFYTGGAIRGDRHDQIRQGERVTERDEVAGLLRAHDARELGDTEDVALRSAAIDHQAHRLG